jgi:hypothetical protein
MPTRRRWFNSPVSTSCGRRRSGTTPQRVLSQGVANVIVLIDGFYQEITAHGTYRCCVANRPAAIPTFSEWSGGRER